MVVSCISRSLNSIVARDLGESTRTCVVWKARSEGLQQHADRAICRTKSDASCHMEAAIDAAGPRVWCSMPATTTRAVRRLPMMNEIRPTCDLVNIMRKYLCTAPAQAPTQYRQQEMTRRKVRIVAVLFYYSRWRTFARQKPVAVMIGILPS